MNINKYVEVLPFVGKKVKGRESEDLYTRILLWANGKQESGFSWEELKEEFDLSDQQAAWVKKIFLTTSDSDRKYFEHYKNDDSVEPNVHYYALNEKGMTAAINYKGLKHAEKSSSYAIWFAGISVILTAVGLYYAVEQTKLTEFASRGDRIIQAKLINDAVAFCVENPEAEDSGLQVVRNGQIATCKQVLDIYGPEDTYWEKFKKTFYR